MKLRPLFCLLLIFALLAMLPAALAVPEPMANGFYVHDFAGVLDDAAIQSMEELGDRLERQGAGQLVLVTVDFTDGTSLHDYAKELFNSWQIGDASRGDGCLILMAIGEDDYFAMPGRGLEQTLTGGRIDQLLYEYMEPGFAVKDYGSAALSAYEAFAEELGLRTGEGTLAPAPGAVRSTRFVQDYAGILSEETVQAVSQTGEANRERLGAALYVRTITGLNGASIDQILYDAYSAVGAGGMDVLLVLSVGDDDYWALQGDQILSILSDSKINDLLYEYLEPGFAARDYDAGVLAVSDAFDRFFRDNEARILYYRDPVGAMTSQQTTSIFDFILPIGIIIVIIFVVASIMAKRKIRRETSYYRQNPLYPPPSYQPPPRDNSGWFWGYMLGRNLGRHRHHHHHYRPPHGPHTPPGGTPPSSGGDTSSGGPSSKSSWGGTWGGAGRSSGWGGSGRSSGGSSWGGAGRSGGFGGGSRGGGGGGGFRGGGGSTRGGGAGRRK